jgi:serine/threonine protein kinase
MSYYDDVNIVKTLGSGMFGTVYLGTKDNKKYAIKIQKILPHHKNKNYKHDIWREVDMYKYIDSLDDSDAKFFSKLYDFQIIDNCNHKQKRNIKLGNDDFSKKLKKYDKSKICAQLITEYKGDTTLSHFLSLKNPSQSVLKSILLQIIKICNILKRGKYVHGDLHTGNIMIHKTNDKTFVLNGKRVKYSGYQLSVIDYGEVMHTKYRLTDKPAFKAFSKNYTQTLFNECKWLIQDIILTSDKYMYNCRKNNRKLPYQKSKDVIDYTLRQIMKNHKKLWLKYKDRYGKRSKLFKLLLSMLEVSKDNIGKMINDSYTKKVVDKKTMEDMHQFVYLVITLFQIDKPATYAHYFGWCSYHQPLISKNKCYEMLKIKNMKKLNSFIKKL